MEVKTQCLAGGAGEGPAGFVFGGGSGETRTDTDPPSPGRLRRAGAWLDEHRETRTDTDGHGPARTRTDKHNVLAGLDVLSEADALAGLDVMRGLVFRGAPGGLERRTAGDGVSLREAGVAGLTQIVGYAAVFNSLERGEVIKPGAFRRSLKEGVDVRAYWQHDSAQPLGRIGNGTLVLKEDKRGLWCEITPNPETSWGRDALASVGRGDVAGMSFGFMIREAGEVVQDGKRVVVLKDLDLREVSPVSEPWYEATEAAARDAGEGAGDTDPHGPTRTHTDEGGGDGVGGESRHEPGGDGQGGVPNADEAEARRAVVLRRLRVVAARMRCAGVDRVD